MGDDTNAEYLYGELAKRDIPAQMRFIDNYTELLKQDKL